MIQFVACSICISIIYVKIQIFKNIHVAQQFYPLAGTNLGAIINSVNRIRVLTRRTIIILYPALQIAAPPVRLYPPGRCNLSEILPHSLDHPTPPDPETEGDPDAPVEQDPDGGETLCRHGPGRTDQPQTHERPNRIAAKD